MPNARFVGEREHCAMLALSKICQLERVCLGQPDTDALILMENPELTKIKTIIHSES
jgi:hypothetical protein